MDFNIETPVTDEVVTENAEGTTAEEIVAQVETPKTYTEEEVNARVDELLGKKIARREAKIRKEYERKYGELESVLKAGIGKNDVEEVTSTLRDYYEKRGVQIPKVPAYSNSDLEVLAKAEADDIIQFGYDEVIEEMNRLASVGVANMSAREKALFSKLGQYQQNVERSKELSKLGVSEDVYDSKEFKDFAAKFTSDTPIAEVYAIYNKTQPHKAVRTIGSMTNKQDKAVKDYYSPEDIAKLTEDDLDDPAVWEAVRKSMTGKS